MRWQYDRAGNRLREDRDGNLTRYSYDAGNQLQQMTTAQGSTDFTWDDAGNLSQKDAPQGLTFYRWDAENRLTEVEPPSGPITLSYNANGARVSKEAAGVTRNYLYDFERLLNESETTGASTTYTSTVEEYGKLLSEYDDAAGARLDHAYDAQWSTNALIDENGAVAETLEYQAFGQPNQPTSATRFDFAGIQGYYHDRETELYLLGGATGGRYYDPSIGRFLSTDPDEFDTEENNLYLYVGNNPVNRVDPSGRGCAWYDLVCKGKNAARAVVRTVRRVARRAWSGLVRFGGLVLEGVQEAAYRAFTAALPSGVSAQQFVKNVRDFASNASSAVGALISRGAAVVRNLGRGLFRGIEIFCGAPANGQGFSCPKFMERIQTAIGDWIGVPSLTKVIKAVQEKGLGAFRDVAGFVVDIVGYSYEDIIAVVGRALGEQNMALLTGAVSAITKGIEGVREAGGVGAYVQQLIADKVEGLQDVAKETWEGVKSGWTSIIPPLAATALAKIAAKFVPGAGWVTALVDVIRFFVNQGPRILALFKTVKAGFSEALNGGRGVVNRIGGKVSETLTTALPAVFSGIAAVFGLDSIPSKIRQVLKSVRRTAQRPLIKLVNAVAKPIRKVIDRIMSGITGAKPLTPPIEVRRGEKSVKVWPEIDRLGRVQVFAASSPKQPIEGDSDSQQKITGSGKQVERLGKKVAQGDKRSSRRLVQETDDLEEAVEKLGKDLLEGKACPVSSATQKAETPSHDRFRPGEPKGRDKPAWGGRVTETPVDKAGDRIGFQDTVLINTYVKRAAEFRESDPKEYGKCGHNLGIGTLRIYEPGAQVSAKHSDIYASSGAMGHSEPQILK